MSQAQELSFSTLAEEECLKYSAYINVCMYGVRKATTTP